MKRASVALVAAGFVAALLAVGCKEKRVTCDKLYQRVAACYSKKERVKPDREAFVADCKKKRSRKPYQSALKCVRKSSCSAFKGCMKQAEVAALRERIQAALKSGQWDALAWVGCTTPELKEPLQAICKKALPAAYRFYVAQAKAERDRPMDQRQGRRRSTFFDLDTLAGQLGQTEVAAARTLRAQVQLSEEVSRAIDAARALLTKLKAKAPPKRPSSGKGAGILGVLAGTAGPSVPESCYLVDERLAKENGPWAVPHRKSLHRHCFVALGRAMLGPALATGKCHDGLRSLYRYLGKRKLSQPDADSLRSELKSLCESGGYGFGHGGFGRYRKTGPRVFMSRAQVSGGLDAATIRRVIRRHLMEIKYCYTSIGIPANPKLAGMVKVSFTITSTGAVGQVAISASTLGHQKTEACIKATVRRWRFPRPEGSMPFVTYPFHFKPQG